MTHHAKLLDACEHERWLLNDFSPSRPAGVSFAPARAARSEEDKLLVIW